MLFQLYESGRLNHNQLLETGLQVANLYTKVDRIIFSLSFASPFLFYVFTFLKPVTTCSCFLFTPLSWVPLFPKVFSSFSLYPVLFTCLLSTPCCLPSVVYYRLGTRFSNLPRRRSLYVPIIITHSQLTMFYLKFVKYGSVLHAEKCVRPAATGPQLEVLQSVQR